MEHLNSQVSFSFHKSLVYHCHTDIQISCFSSFITSSPQLVVDVTLVYTNWKRLQLKLPTISEMG